MFIVEEVRIINDRAKYSNLKSKIIIIAANYKEEQAVETVKSVHLDVDLIRSKQT